MGRPAQELIGRTIAGKFFVESAIGSGAMGAVYRARQVALDKTVAIKVLHGEHADDPSFAARFQREAKAASRLNHPNSMQVIDFGAEPDGLLYIAMEYLDGRSLHRVLHEDGPLTASRIADILMQTLAALAVAHDMGVVHRDLKPENVVVLRAADDDGRPKDLVKVCDFGIAKITDSRAYRSSGGGERDSNGPATTAGFLVGTPEYMSPEQARGDKIDARSDVYAVGVILYEMLTGRVPFDAESAIGIVLKHITEEPPRPSQRAPGVDARLEAVCKHAMRKTREARFQSARDMRAALRPVVETTVVVPVPHRSSPSGRIAAPAPGGHADTLRMAPAGAGSAYETAPKMTLAGTAAPVGRRAGRLTKVALLAMLTGIAASVGVITLAARYRLGRRRRRFPRRSAPRKKRRPVRRPRPTRPTPRPATSPRRPGRRRLPAAPHVRPHSTAFTRPRYRPRPEPQRICPPHLAVPSAAALSRGIVGPRRRPIGRAPGDRAAGRPAGRPRLRPQPRVRRGGSHQRAGCARACRARGPPWCPARRVLSRRAQVARRARHRPGDAQSLDRRPRDGPVGHRDGRGLPARARALPSRGSHRSERSQIAGGRVRRHRRNHDRLQVALIGRFPLCAIALHARLAAGFVRGHLARR